MASLNAVHAWHTVNSAIQRICFYRIFEVQLAQRVRLATIGLLVPTRLLAVVRHALQDAPSAVRQPPARAVSLITCLQKMYPYSVMVGLLIMCSILRYMRDLN